MGSSRASGTESILVWPGVLFDFRLYTVENHLVGDFGSNNFLRWILKTPDDRTTWCQLNALLMSLHKLH